jgi:hypothetical protein
MSQFKKSLDSSVLKEKLSNLLENVDRNNTSKMIIERHFANLTSLEISEGTVTAKDAYDELRGIGVEQNKARTLATTSVINENKTTVSDPYLLRRIAILESTIKDLKVYDWMKPIGTFIAETKEFLKRNELAILIEGVTYDLEMDKNSGYYKKAITLLGEAATSENQVFFITENMENEKWIPLVKRLVEHCESIKGSVNGHNPNFKVNRVYSPIEFVKENETYAFYSNGKVFETNGSTITESTTPVTESFKKLVRITESAKFANKMLRLYPNPNSVIDIDFTNESTSVLINNKLVETTSVESHLVAGGYLKYGEIEKAAQISHAIAEGRNIKELDFAYKITSNLFEGVSVNIFNINENVYIQKINPSMKENSFILAESAEEAVRIVKDFMNYDISGSLNHLIENETAEKDLKAKEVTKIENRIKFLTESIDNLNRVAKLNGVENTSKIKAAKELLETQIEEQNSILSKLSNSSVNEAKKNNFSKKDFPIKALVHMEDGVFIVSKGPNGFGFGDEKSQIFLKPFDTRAKSKRSAAAASYTIDVLNKNVTKIEESTYEGTEDSVNEATKNNFKNTDFPIGALVHTQEDGVFIVSKGPNNFGFKDEKGKIWLKPHDNVAKKHYKGVGEYTIDILNKKVTKIEESTHEGNEDSLNEACTPGKEYKIGGEAGWIYQGVADGLHIFNNEAGGKDPMNYSDIEFTKAHQSGEITECA